MPWHELLGPLHRLPQPVALDGWFAVLQAHCTGGTFELPCSEGDWRPRLDWLFCLAIKRRYSGWAG